MSIREYQFGSTGEDVKRIQRALNAKLGSSLEIDGKYGILTQAAVIKFQQSREDLKVDGIVGAFTWNALGLNELTPPSPTFDSVEPPTIPPPVKESPEQIQQRRLRQRQKDQTQQKSVDIASLDTSNIELPKDVQPSGQDKLNQLTVQKAINFVGANLGVIDEVLKSLGLPNSQNLKQLQAQGEEAVEAFIQGQSCANKETLQEAVRIRNEVNEQLGRLGQSYNLTNRALNRLSDFVAGQVNTTQFLKSLRAITSVAMKTPYLSVALPPGVPNPIPYLASSLNDISAVVDIIIFSALGEPKLKKAKATVDNGLMFISMSSQVLKRVLEPLSILDRTLVKCGQTITPIPDSIVELQQVNQTTELSDNSNYKGFTLEIIEEPFSSTVTRRKAVAKNTQGIILVETPLSFTTLEQILLDQVKFIIDSQNLKPN